MEIGARTRFIKISLTIIGAIVVLFSFYIGIIGLYFKEALFSPWWALTLTASAVFVFGMPVIIFSERWHERSYLRDLLSDPGGCLLSTALAAFTNAFFHEYPNTYAHEWTYTIQTGTFLDALVLGIPLLVWFGWPVLVIVPTSLYYLFEK